MRIVIVEDSLEDLLNLRSLLGAMSDMEIVGVAHCLKDAREVIQECKPDLVFLDIELGPDNSFELIHDIPRETRIIFCTVHTGYGAAAFDINAVDYIVKPVNEERLLRALSKLPQGAGPLTTQVLVYRGGSERHSLALSTIAAIIADRDHSMVLCGSKHYPDHRRFREWGELLQEHPFTQLDRSTLIRLDMIHSWQPYGSGMILKFRHSTTTQEIGRAAAKRFLELMGDSVPHS